MTPWGTPKGTLSGGGRGLGPPGHVLDGKNLDLGPREAWKGWFLGMAHPLEWQATDQALTYPLFAQRPPTCSLRPGGVVVHTPQPTTSDQGVVVRHGAKYKPKNRTTYNLRPGGGGGRKDPQPAASDQGVVGVQGWSLGKGGTSKCSLMVSMLSFPRRNF